LDRRHGACFLAKRLSGAGLGHCNKPAGTHDRVRQSADTYESFRAAFPVMRFRRAVALTGTVREANCGHQRDARFPGSQRVQDVTNATVIDSLRSYPSFAVRPRREYDCIDAIHSGREASGTGDIADNNPRLRRKCMCLLRVTHQRANRVAPLERSLRSESSATKR
jgi:hypothetical protein